MRRLLGFLAVTALAIFAAVWLADRPGEVTIHWQGWRMDTTVPVLLLALLTVLAVLAGALRLVRLVGGAPGRFLAHRRAERTRKGYLALSDGLAAVASGDSRGATRLARKADSLLKDAALTSLLTSQAALMLGNADEQQAGYQAMLERPETTFLGLRGLTDLALRSHDRAGALDHARRAFALQPTAPALAETLFNLQVEAAQWAEAELTLVTARRHKVIAADRLARLRAVVALARAEAAEREGQAGDALSLALDSCDLDPGLVPAVVLAARLLRDKGKARRADRLILAGYAQTPHPALVAAWRDAGGAVTELEQVKRLQKLVAANPTVPQSHLALAEAALAARLWGQARTHLERVMDQRPTRRTLDLLARLEREERKDEGAALAWAARAGEVGPEPAWTCGGCGHTQADFALLCPACGAAGRQDWTS